MPKLTSRQEEILSFIKSYIQTHGYPPTRSDIASEFNFSSPNAAEDHLKALAKKNFIELIPGTSRGIKLCEEITPTEDIRYAHMSSNQIHLPLIGHVAAGNPILATENFDRELAIDPSLFDQTPDYFLRVRGESMKDIGIMDGDFLAVRKQSDARNGQIVVARIDDEVTVKRLLRKSNRIELLPENEAFEPIVVSPDVNFAIEGIAVGLIRPNTLF